MGAIKKCFTKKMNILIAFICVVTIAIIYIVAVKADEQKWTYSYKGYTESFVAPKTGKYYVELYGGSGGGVQAGDKGGYSGYTNGYINLNAGDIIYICVGQSGSVNGTNIYNGGGDGGNNAGSGGGATHIAYSDGILSDLVDIKDKVIAVAGGGGGQNSKAHYNGANFDRIIGSGGGLNGGSTNNAFGGDQELGYAFGKGQSASADFNWGGAGGGGWYGGEASNSEYYGGGGGSSYIDGLYNANTFSSTKIGDGSVTITYKGETSTKLTIEVGENGKYKEEKGTIIIEGTEGDRVWISDVIPEPGYEFIEWKVVEGEFNPVFNVFTFGSTDTKIVAQYKAPLLLTVIDEPNVEADEKVLLEWHENDEFNKIYRIKQSTDGQNWSYIVDGHSSDIVKSAKYGPGAHVYNVELTGRYYIELYGAQGQNGYDSVGGKGGYVAGYVDLQEGMKLYFNVGGQDGYNGGGAGSAPGLYCDSGSGGGATHVAFTDYGELSNYVGRELDVIAVAGGGGGGAGSGTFGEGATFGGGDGGYGGLTGSDGTQNTDFKNHEILNGFPGTGATEFAPGVGGATGTHHSHGKDNVYYTGAGGGGGGGWYGGGGGGTGYMDSDVEEHCLGNAGEDGSFGQGGAGGSYIVADAWNSGNGAGGGGGSSYISSILTESKHESNNHEGNGYATITPVFDYTEYDGTNASVDIIDIKAPNKPDVNTLNFVNDILVVNWNIPKDNGDIYYHQVESYNNDTKEYLNSSNIVVKEAKCGVKGYYYVVNSNYNTQVSNGNTFTYENYYNTGMTQDILNTYTERYLHVAAVDWAGNVGETYHIPLIRYTDTEDIYVKAPDKAAPYPPFDGQVLRQEGYDTIIMTWSIPKDNSTVYVNKVESYLRNGYKKLLVSNTVTNEMLSGLSGYYYYIDNNLDGLVTKNNSILTYTNTAKVMLKDENGDYYEQRYIHIAAVDKAGNISPTYTYPFNIADERTQPVYTDMIKISSKKDNYFLDSADTNTFFVQGSENKNSKFNLAFNGYLYDKGTYSFQVTDTYLDIWEKKSGQLITQKTPNTRGAKSWAILDLEPFGTWNIINNIVDVNNISVIRSDDLRTLNMLTEMSVDKSYDNKIITLVPEARAYYSKETKYISSKDQFVDYNGNLVDGSQLDYANRINLIVDSTAPAVVIENKYDPSSPDYDPLITEPTEITIDYADYTSDSTPTDPDYGSGIKPGTGSLKVTITQEQSDDGGIPLVKTYTEETVDTMVSIVPNNNKTGTIKLKIDPKQYEEMSGFINIKVELMDNVGNLTVKEYRFLIMQLDLDVEVVNTLPGREPKNLFVAGEQGMLIIETNGFVDQVDAKFGDYLNTLADEEGRIMDETFPRDENDEITRVFPELQTKYWGTTHMGGMEYDGEDYVHSYLVHYFYVPVYTNDGRYEIQVTAHKLDPLTGKDYTISKDVHILIGETNITDQLKDTIKDN